MPLKTRRQWLAAAISAAGLTAALLSGSQDGGSAGPNAASDNSMKMVANASESFVIDAPDVRQLYPGATKYLEVTVANPYRFAIRVTALSGEVVATSTAACRPVASNLMVLNHRGKLPVVRAKRQASAGKIPIYMPNSVRDACQNVTFTIRLTGKAEKVSS